MTTLPARIGAALALAVGTALLWAVPAQAAPGDLDPSFGGDGVVTVDVAEEEGNAVALAPDGDIVVVGTVTELTGETILTREEDLLIARFRPDGSLDPEFGGGDGLVRTDVDAGSADAARAVAIHTDGTIAVAGESRGHFMVARYTANGVLDPSFGGDGIVTLPIGLSSGAEDVLVEPDGQIVVAGASGARSGASFIDQQKVARFDADGTLDASFATLGVATGDEGRFERVGLDAVGRIVAAGTTGDDFAVARYMPDGLADPAFSGDGKTTTDFGAFDEEVRGMAVGADGSIVAAGLGATGDFLLARYTPAGALDPAFAGDGKLVDDLGGNDRAGAVALQPDGKIVVAGLRFASDLRFAVVRYHADGSRDPGFGDGGLVVGPPSSAVADAVLQPDGKILLAGSELTFTGGIATEQDVAVTRLLGGEPQPPSPPPPIIPPPAPIPRATPPPPPPPLPSSDPCGVPGAAGYLYPAKLRVSRSRVLRSDRRLDVYAPITSRARGEVEVTYQGDRRTTTFAAEVTSGDATLDRIRFKEPITAGQARLGTGIVTLNYQGDGDTRPEEVRLRAASQHADLDVAQISLLDGRLSARGSVTSRAQGIVRLRYSYLDAAGQPQIYPARATIQADGDWELKDDPVPPQLASCGGYLSILFTGYFERRIRGEMLAYQLNAGQTRRP